MEHSRLLKYILPENTEKNKMAEPVKIKFEYQKPENVQSEVPGVQKLREDSENGNEAITKRTMRRNNSYSGAQAPAVDHQRLNRRHSNIANTSIDDKIEEKKTRTRIPVSRFRQTVEKVKAERREIKEKKDQESHFPIRRSSIPKAIGKTPTPIKPVRKSIPKKATEEVKHEVVQPEIEKTKDVEYTVTKADLPEPTVMKTEVTEVTAPEDEFDKLYEEVTQSLTPINIDVSLLNPKVDDPEKLESKFEEIIQDYDTNRVQPIDVDKIKKSRIPFLKRKSQQDERGDRSGKMIAARDKLRMRRSSSKSDDIIDGKANNNTVIDIIEDKSQTYGQTVVNSVNTANDSQNELHIQNNVRVEEIDYNDKFEELVAQNDVTVEEVSNKVFDEIAELKCNAQNDNDDAKSVNNIDDTQNNIIVEGIKNYEKFEDDKQELVAQNDVRVQVVSNKVFDDIEELEFNAKNDDQKSVNTIEIVDIDHTQNHVRVEVKESNDQFEDDNCELIAQNDVTVTEVTNKVFVDVEHLEFNAKNDNDDKKPVNTIEIVDIDDTQNNVKVEEIESNDKFEDDTHELVAQNDNPVQVVSNKVVAEIEELEFNAQNDIDDQKLVNTIETVDIDNTQNNVKVEEIESNDKFEDDTHELVDQNDVPVQVVSNKVFAEIEELEFNAQNDIDDEKSVNTREVVDLDLQPEIYKSVEVSIETLDFQDNSNDENYETFANNVLVSPVMEYDNLKSENHAFEDGVTATTEQDYVKPEISLEIKTLEDEIQLEETININPSPEDEFIKLIDASPVAENPINVQNIEVITEQIKEENIYLNSVQIGIPAFDLKVQEQEERDPEIVIREEPIYTPYREDTPVTDKVKITEINSKPITDVFNTENSETVDTSEEEKLVPKKHTEIEDIRIVIKEKDGSIEDVAKLKGKVGRLISKIDSNDPSETQKVDINNDLPKKRSVLSKIAMFERHDAVPAFKSKIPKTQLPKLQTANKQTNKVHIHTPLVVDEVFKPFASKIIHNNNVNKVEITNGDNVTQIVKAEMAIIESPNNSYGVENKVEIQSNTVFIEESKIKEEVLAPVRRYEPTTEVTEGDNYKRWPIEDTPVVVPKFVPVRDVLKKYESINNHTSKTVVIPKVKPISEIIKTLKPESNPRSLETMFSHQSRPVTDILNDLKPHKEELTNTKKDELSNEDLEYYDKTRHGFKSFKSRGYEYQTQESDDNNFKTLQYIQDYHNAKAKTEELRKAKSLVELDLGDVVKGKVNKLVVRMNSLDIIGNETKEVAINQKELPRKRSVSEKIALFERKITPMRTEPPKPGKATPAPPAELTPELRAKIAELSAAKQKYGTTVVPTISLADGTVMPAIALGTALQDPRLVFHVVCAAIDLGYRAIDTAYIYGNEKAVGEAIRAKIKDGTVTRGELFIMSKLWSTFHRRDLVAAACEASLAALGLDYFDLYMIHNPMSFKEGGDPIPKIATVLQYSESDYLDAWFGMEALGARARALGLSNFNSAQIQRVLDRARIKPIVNQVECHPYLSQQKLGDFCSERNVTLSCYGVLGSKGTPQEYKNGQPAAIDDPLVQVMASGLNVSPAQLLIRYQLQCGRQVVVKSSSASNLWNNLQVGFNLTSAQFDAIRALNRNKRNFTFRGMGDTHKNYPFNEPF